MRKALDIFKVAVVAAALLGTAFLQGQSYATEARALSETVPTADVVSVDPIGSFADFTGF